MAVVDLEKIGLFQTIRKKLKRDMIIYPLLPYKGGGFKTTLLNGIYQMRPRPYVGPQHKHPRYGPAICVREVLYEPSDQTQPNKVARQIIFVAAVAAWQVLHVVEKQEYNRKAFGKHMSGYNLFLRYYLKSH